MKIVGLIALVLAGLAGSGMAIAQIVGPVPIFDLAEDPPQLSRHVLRYASSQGSIHLLVPRRDRPPPLVIQLSGADFGRDAARYPTQWLPNFFFERGYALAMVRTSPPRRIRAAGVLEESIAAIAELVADAERHRYDASRIILMGKGAGGQLAALLGTDHRLLARAGLAPESVRAVLILNGDAFDLPDRIATSPDFRRRQYELAFGSRAEDHHRLSPAAHLESPNAPIFLLYATEGLSDFAAQAEAFGALLRRAGSVAELALVPKSLGGAATLIGAPQNPQSAVLLDRLDRAIGAR